MSRLRKNTGTIAGVAVRLSLLIALLIALAGCATSSPTQPEPTPPNKHTEAIDMSVSFIDVGQGDAILITSEGKSLLVDAGKKGSGDEVVAYLQDQGVEKIGYLVATHPDADHIGGMVEVLDAFAVGHAVISPKSTSKTQTYQEFAAAVEREPGVGFTTPDVGSTFQLGDATVEVLANGNGEVDTNAASIVLKATCGAKSALLTGDIPVRVELELLLRAAPLDSDLLKVAHHGSHKSSDTAFLAAVSPEYAVISVGKNSYGHPRPEALERLVASGAVIYRTDLIGTVEFLFSDGKITPAKAA